MSLKIWTDREGRKLTAKEFIERFKEGVTQISPIQQARTSLVGQGIILGGVIFGLIVNLVAHVWWLFVILLGSLIVVSTATLGAWQKFKVLKKMEESFEKIEEVTNEMD